MVFPIKQIAINQLKNLTEQQDHLSFHYSNQCITSFTLISHWENQSPSHSNFSDQAIFVNYCASHNPLIDASKNRDQGRAAAYQYQAR